MPREVFLSLDWPGKIVEPLKRMGRAWFQLGERVLSAPEELELESLARQRRGKQGEIDGGLSLWKRMIL